jgi:hypothetical protein
MYIAAMMWLTKTYSAKPFREFMVSLTPLIIKGKVSPFQKVGGCNIIHLRAVADEVLEMLYIIIEQWTGGPKICGSGPSQGNLIFL